MSIIGSWVPPLRWLASLLMAVTSSAGAQWAPQLSGSDAAFRGFSVIDSSSAWVSGTRGTFAWTDDRGQHWHPGRVPAARSQDFRAVHAFSLDSALLMVSGQDTALIYRTTDRGRNWTEQYRDTRKGAFLDAIAFFDSNHGLALGDPVSGKFVILETQDGGINWTRGSTASLPPALPGEGAFAASGTALITCGPHDAWFGTGGAARSRVFHSSDSGLTWSATETPIAAGTAAAGIFSLACRDVRHLIAVGGNYAKPDTTAVTVALSNDGGLTWVAASPASSTGYLSGVAYAGGGSRVVAVGTQGTATSGDAGRSWSGMDPQSLNVVMSVSHSGAVWAAGPHGRIVMLSAAESSKH